MALACPAAPEVDDYGLIDSLMQAAQFGDGKAYHELMIAAGDEPVIRHGSQYLIHDLLNACRDAVMPILILAPPEHAKSSIIRSWLSEQTARDPATRSAIVSADEDLAKKHLTTIRKWLTHKMHRAMFPRLAPDTKRSVNSGEWSATRVYFQDQPNASFEVCPFDGYSEGGRFKFVWLDDVVTRRCERSEAERERAHSALHKTWLNRIVAGGIPIISNNVWHREDPCQQLKNSPSFCVLEIGYESTERMFWRITNPPATWARETEGHFALWANWPKQRLEAKRLEDRNTWEKLYRLRATVAEASQFTPPERWGRYAALPPPGAGARIYGFLDPSGGRGSKNEDYAAIWLVLAKWDRVLLVIDGYVGRCTADEQVKKCYDMHRKWLAAGYGGIQTLRYEALKKDWDWVRKTWEYEAQRLREKNDPAWMLNAQPFPPLESKESHILCLEPWLANQWLLFPHDMEQRIQGRSELGLACRLLSEHLEDFPFGDHDDAPDGLMGAVDLASSGGVAKEPWTEEGKMRAFLAAQEAEARANVFRPLGLDGKLELVRAGNTFGF